MRSAIVALTLTALSTVGHAQETEPPEVAGFRSLAAGIPGDPVVTDEWSKLLPTIARHCGMVVDRQSVRTIMGRSRTPTANDESAHRREDRLKASWNAMAARDLDAACRTADGLWGEEGTAFPGVLRDNVDASTP